MSVSWEQLWLSLNDIAGALCRSSVIRAIRVRLYGEHGQILGSLQILEILVDGSPLALWLFPESLGWRCPGVDLAVDLAFVLSYTNTIFWL